MSILAINAGSSSLKFGLFEARSCTLLVSGLIDWSANRQRADLVLKQPGAEDVRYPLDVSDHRAAVTGALRTLAERKLTSSGSDAAIAAVGHRVVHGGVRFRSSVKIDRAVKDGIAQLTELAPLHNPPALEALAAAEAILPDVAHVAVFDTAFFADLPASSQVYPLPYDWYADWGVRRFGFHGISHAYCAGRASELLGRDPAKLRLVICHLGNGCSATAVRGGIAIATTMGFTPLEGLMMGTRAGNIDPGILIYLQRQRGLSVEQIEEALTRHSGLAGVSGISSDFREVESAAQQGHERARLALEIYAGRVRATVGALAATLGGIDALVFTAGIGENSATLRTAACSGLECLGLRIDPQGNAACRPDADIALPESSARILVLRTHEEWMIARETYRVAIARERQHGHCDFAL